MKLMSDFKKNFWPIGQKFFSSESASLCACLDLKPHLLGHICLVGSLFQGSYTSIFITYSLAKYEFASIENARLTVWKLIIINSMTLTKTQHN
jgi:hypothetical protein